MKKIVCILGFFALCTAAAKAQNPKLSLYFSDSATNSMYNPDSVMRDTCSTSSTFDKVYIKQGIRVIFDSANMLNLPWAPADSDLEVSWTAVDTQWIDYRSAFGKLDASSLHSTSGTYFIHMTATDPTTGELLWQSAEAVMLAA